MRQPRLKPDYRFCSYGVWRQTGRHPITAALAETLIPALPEGLNRLEPSAVRDELGQAFARLAPETRTPEDETSPDPAVEAPFCLSARRHVRHWVDGLVIGSEIFVRETLGRVRTAREVAQRRLVLAADTPPERLPVCCWGRLRVLRN